MTTCYYKVRKGSAADKVMDDMKAQIKKRDDATIAWCAQAKLPRGVILCQATGGRLDSVRSPDTKVPLPAKIPTGFKKTRYDYMWVLDWKDPVGRKLGMAYVKLPEYPSDMEASTALFEHGLLVGRIPHGTGMALSYAMFYDLPGGRLIAAPYKLVSTCKRWPKGLLEIKGTDAAKLIGTAEAAQ